MWFINVVTHRTLSDASVLRRARLHGGPERAAATAPARMRVAAVGDRAREGAAETSSARLMRRMASLGFTAGVPIHGETSMSEPDAPTPAAAPAAAAAAAPAAAADGLLPVDSISHIMKRAIGGQHSAVSETSVAAVQLCTSEFLSLVVHEARQRVAKEGRESVSYSDVAAALSTLGFHAFLEPVRKHMAQHYGEGAMKRPPKRSHQQAMAGSPTPPTEAPPVIEPPAAPPVTEPPALSSPSAALPLAVPSAVPEAVPEAAATEAAPEAVPETVKTDVH